MPASAVEAETRRWTAYRLQAFLGKVEDAPFTGPAIEAYATTTTVDRRASIAVAPAPAVAMSYRRSQPAPTSTNG